MTSQKNVCVRGYTIRSPLFTPNTQSQTSLACPQTVLFSCPQYLELTSKCCCPGKCGSPPGMNVVYEQIKLFTFKGVGVIADVTMTASMQNSCHFFHVFQASMKRSWSARHAPSPSRVTRSPRLAHPRLKKRKNSPYSVGYCHKGLPNQRYNVPSFQKDNRRRLSSRYTNESIQGLLPL